MSAHVATYRAETVGVFPAALLLLVLVLTALGIVAHAAFM
jgi:hypothetical protein